MNRKQFILLLVMILAIGLGCTRPNTQNTPRTTEEIQHFSYEDNFRDGFVEREDGVYLVKKLPEHITMIDGKFYDLSRSEVSVYDIVRMDDGTLGWASDDLHRLTEKINKAKDSLRRTLDRMKELEGTSDSLNKPATQDDE